MRSASAPKVRGERLGRPGCPTDCGDQVRPLSCGVLTRRLDGKITLGAPSRKLAVCVRASTDSKRMWAALRGMARRVGIAPPRSSLLGVRPLSSAVSDEMAIDLENVKKTVEERKKSVTPPHVAVVPDALSPVRLPASCDAAHHLPPPGQAPPPPQTALFSRAGAPREPQ